MRELLALVKEENQDFDWYPTTDEILEEVLNYIRAKKIHGIHSVLDIGAGNGKVLDFFKNNIDKYISTYAIEKSMPLIEELRKKRHLIIGMDFLKQNLTLKKYDLIFCNPPYSEWVEWAKKILTEASGRFIVLVLPARWKNNKEIINIIEDRDLEYNILGKFDFLNAERQARVNVDLIFLKSKKYEKYADSFDYIFDKVFKIKINKKEKEKEWEKIVEDKNNKKIKKEIVKKQNLIEALVECYNHDLDNLINSYKKLSEIDYSILEDAGVEISLYQIKNNFKEKIENLKFEYWKILFENLESIYNRLTSSYRDAIYSLLVERNQLDFEPENIYYITIETIKNAKEFINEQIKDLFKKFEKSNKGLIGYKSNEVFNNGKWRYTGEGKGKYYLDYRIVYQAWCCFPQYEWDSIKGLDKKVAKFLNDIVTIGKTLGFNIVDRAESFYWERGEENTFYLYQDEKYIPFMSVRCYQNGNIHIKFNQEFIKKLNIIAGKLFGWLKSPEDALKEMDNITEEEATKHFNTQIKLTIPQYLALPENI